MIPPDHPVQRLQRTAVALALLLVAGRAAGAAAIPAFTIERLDPQDGSTRWPHAINNLGQIAGAGNGYGDPWSAVLWTSPHEPRELRAGWGEAYDLNDLSHVVGRTGLRAFLWTRQTGNVTWAHSVEVTVEPWVSTIQARW
jgi:hypothetical protein